LAAAAASEVEAKPQTARCGAKTQAGTPCKRPAGAGTDHLGYGRCMKHGGTNPAGRVSGARLMAEALGAELRVDPHEALLVAVGQASQWELVCRAKVAELTDDQLTVESRKERVDAEGHTTVETSNDARLNLWLIAHQRAVRDLASIAKTALDAGVEERRVRVAEQFGSQIAELMGRVFAELDLTPEQRKQAPAIVGRHLRALEAGPAQVAA